MKKILSVIALLWAFVAQAQNVEMADTMRSNGKIYVVVLVILILLIGLFTFLFLAERRLKKLEDEIKGGK